MQRLLALTLMLTLFALSPVALHAQDCATLVREYTDWLNGTEVVPARTRKAVGFTIATNQRNDQPADNLHLPIHNNFEATLKSVNLVAYGIGNLRVLEEGGVQKLDGVGQFYFSDRSNDPGSTVYTGFSGRTDGIRLRIAPNGTVAITLVAWGNAAVPISARCENGVLFGFGSGMGGISRPAMYVVSLYKHFIPL